MSFSADLSTVPVYLRSAMSPVDNSAAEIVDLLAGRGMSVRQSDVQDLLDDGITQVSAIEDYLRKAGEYSSIGPAVGGGTPEGRAAAIEAAAPTWWDSWVSPVVAGAKGAGASVSEQAEALIPRSGKAAVVVVAVVAVAVVAYLVHSVAALAKAIK